MENDKPFTIKSFYEYLEKSRLMGARCNGCGRLTVPPRPICPDCRKSDLEWFEFKGKGSLDIFTVIHVPPPSLAEKKSYVVGLVQLEEGPLIMGRILVKLEDIDKIKPDVEWKLEPLKEGNGTIIAFKSICGD